jgi:hypothetical protein
MSAFKTKNTHSSERVQDLLINAVETVSDYWCSNINQIHEGDIYDIDNPDWKWEVTEDESGKVYTITRDSLKSGLKAFKKIVPHHFRAWEAEDDDGETADCFFQCVVLGDVIYG